MHTVVGESVSKFQSKAFNAFAILVAIGLACGGELSLLFLQDFSLQAIWTSLVFFALVLISVRFIKKSVVQLGLLVSVAGLLLACGSLLSDGDSSEIGYIISGLCFVLSLAIARAGFHPASQTLLLLIASNCLLFSAPILMHFGLAGDNRILQMSVAFAALMLFLILEMQSRRAHVAISLVAITFAAAFVYWDGARTASVLLLVGTIAFGCFGRGTKRSWRYAFILGQVVLLSIATTFHFLSGRWSGGDQGIGIGGVSINTNGRVSLWQAAVGPMTRGERSDGLNFEWLFGSGIGSSAKSSLELLDQPAPLNEFVRLWVDLGFVGVTAWCGLLAYLLFKTGRMFFSSSMRPTGAIGIAAVIGLVIYSLTENMIAYSWVLVPLALLLGLRIRAFEELRQRTVTYRPTNLLNGGAEPQ